MSSLRIQGLWSTLTSTTGTWFSGQSKCSVSLFLKVNAPSLSAGLVMSPNGGNPLFLKTNQVAQLSPQMLGTGAMLQGNVPYGVGRVHHLAISWDSTANQTAYVDAVSASRITTGGLTRTNTGKLMIGLSVLYAPCDVSIRGLAAWHGYALTAADVLSLANGVDPTSMATPPNWYWTLTGTPGAVANPALDPGFLSAGVQFSAPVGTGTGTYTADNLTWVSPQAPADIRTGKSGSTIFILPGVATVPLTTMPALTVNGSAAAIAQGPRDPAFWCFSMPQVLASDTLRITAPQAWAGTAPVLNQAVRNLRGQCEFPIANPRTMGLGYNVGLKPIGDDVEWCPIANWWRRIRPWNWAGPVVTAVDAVGNPIRFAPGRTYVEGIYSSSRWTPVGRWTLVYDSLDNNATSLDLTFQGSPGPVYHPELSSPTGTNGIGCTKVYDVTSSGAVVRISHPAGTPKFANAQILPPGNQPSTDPLASEATITSWMDLGGGKGPATLRFVDSCANAGGQTFEAVAGDQPSIQPASWSNTGPTLTVGLTRVRPLDMSLQVTTPSGQQPWPSDPMSIIWGGNTYMGELVCAAPHGLSTFQMATLVLNIPSVTVGYNGGTVVPLPSSFGAFIYVTSPTTFTFVGTGAPLAGNRSTVSVAQDLTGATATVSPRRNGILMPREFCAHLASRWPETILWVNMPSTANDSYVDTIADILAPYPCRVLIELGNEDWNSIFNQWGLFYSLTRLYGLPGVVEGYQVKRSLEVAARFRQAFVAAGRKSTDVLSSLMGQYANMNGVLIDQAIAAFQAGQGAFDVLGSAPYMDLLITDASMTGWTPGQALDLMRHYMALDPREASWRADTTNAIARYEAAVGHRVLRYAYEGGIETVACLVNPPNTQYVSAWDWYYHPDLKDTEQVLYTLLQQAGFDVLTQFTFLIAGPNSLGLNWATFASQQQGPGAGDGSDGLAVNTFAGAYVPGNVSVRGYLIRAWQQAQVPGGPHRVLATPDPSLSSWQTLGVPSN